MRTTTMVNGPSLLNVTAASPTTNSLTFYFVPFYTILFFLGTFGNGLVITSIVRSSRLRTVTNTYLLNIAIADFLLLLSIPFLIVTILANGWIFGNVLCKMYYNFIHINQYVSSLLLAALSFDRYLAVCHPIRAIEFRTRTKCALIIAGDEVQPDRSVSFALLLLLSRSSLLVDFRSVSLSDVGFRNGHVRTLRALVWISRAEVSRSAHFKLKALEQRSSAENETMSFPCGAFRSIRVANKTEISSKIARRSQFVLLSKAKEKFLSRIHPDTHSFHIFQLVDDDQKNEREKTFP